jgi:hypothetical protein
VPGLKPETRSPVLAALFQSSHFKLIPKLTAKIAEIAKIKQSKTEQLIFVFFAFFVVEFKESR